MVCPSCSLDNPSSTTVCGSCNTSLRISCDSCGFESPLGYKFCGECGSAIAGREQRLSPVRQAANDEGEDAERRQLTVMFCDLVGATALSEALDPEELRRVLGTWQAACGQVTSQLGGWIAQYLGDGILVYFGFPEAHEDDAVRAVHAGLGILAATRKLSVGSLKRGGPSLSVRVGIHTGEVVTAAIGVGGRQERLALGETPNIAARLQGLAEPDSVVLSVDSHRLTAGFFVFEDLGARVLKGLSRPLPLFRAVSVTSIQSRFDLAVSQGLIPLVGRQEELGLLRKALLAAPDEGSCAVILGEAGIGKSRLVHALRSSLPAELGQLYCRCAALSASSPFSPIIDLLQRTFELHGKESAEARLARLERVLESLGLDPGSTLPSLCSLLSLPLPESSPALSPQLQKERLLETLHRLLESLVGDGSMLLIMEDLHWVDPSSLELLEQLIEQRAIGGLRILITARPSFEPPWLGEGVIQVRLERLSRPQVASMVSHVAGGRQLSDHLLEQLEERTDGVPIFVEELTKMVFESGMLEQETTDALAESGLPILDIPATLQDSLMARLDQLSTVKETAQLCAVFGREFSYEMLRAVSGLDETRLRADLAELTDRELLFQRGLPPASLYIFKHALIQDAAYQSLLRSTRQRLHRRTADVLLESCQELVQAQPELVAHHYTLAGCASEGIDYWQRAAEKALAGSANLEAVGHFTRGLGLVEGLPAGEVRDQKELQLQVALGPALIATKGYVAPEVQQSYNRALELCERLADSPELFWVLWGLGSFYQSRTDLLNSREISSRLVELASRQGKPELLQTAYFSVGVDETLEGHLGLARQAFERGFGVFEVLQSQTTLSATGQDERVAALLYLALVLWQLGLPDEALGRCTEAEELARRLEQPFTRAGCFALSAWIHHLLGDVEMVAERASRATALAEEHGFPMWASWGKILEGWALVRRGEPQAGRSLVEAGLAAFQASGMTVWTTYFQAVLAELHLTRGSWDGGLAVVASGLAAARIGEKFWEPELHRLRGELLLGHQPGAVEEAEVCIVRAVEIARQKGARAFELRAMTSLCGLPSTAALPDRAERLRELHQAFDSRLETADLRRSRSMLKRLVEDGRLPPHI